MNPLNPKMPSVMKHDFQHTPTVNSRRSKFAQPARLVTMFDSGKLIPIEVMEILPGDSVKIDNTILCRLTTPIVPFMDNLYLDTQYFFVPNRLVWENFKKMMGEKANPDSSIDYTVPVVTAPTGGHLVESLADYFGIRIEVEKDVNAMPFRAYNLIYNEFYRDQNIIDSLTVPTDDGPDLDTLYTVQRRGKRFDYFTSCLTQPQSGDPVSIAMTGNAPITGIGALDQNWSAYTPVPVYETDASGTVTYTKAKAVGDASNDRYFLAEEDPNNTGYPNIRADLSGVTAVTISAWREALQLQALAELEMRGGQRYIEIVYSSFQVKSPDARLQRPEYLGGSSTPIYVNPVAQNSSTGATGTPQGNLAAFAVGLNRRDGFFKSFTEHGFIIGIASVRADLTYSQGVHRMWTRETKYDYMWPLLQNIGDQAVLQQEIFCSGVTAEDETVFGYQERYAEYMYGQSQITGKLRPDYATSLDYWHLSQEFASAPTLDQTFIEENPPVDRVVAVTDEPQFVMDIYKNTEMTRAMGRYSLPGYLGSRL